MNSNAALTLAGVGATACAALATRDLSRLWTRIGLHRLYSRVTRTPVPDSDLMSRPLVSDSPIVSALLRELQADLPGVRFRSSYLQFGSRLTFSAVDRDGKSLHIKTIGDNASSAHARQSLFNEALMLSQLQGVRSPRLISVASTQRSNRPYVVRERVFGVSLDRVLQKRAIDGNPPTYREARDLLLELGHAVSEVHQAHVVHGDIKPANIVADWSSSADEMTFGNLRKLTLIDFESASVIDEAGGSLNSLWRGTPYFMAPERYAQAFLGPVADIYSCSALASLILTGRPVRPGSTAGKRIPSEDLRREVRRGMSVDPRGRHSSMTEWTERISGAFADLIESAGDERVIWPEDGTTLAQELSREALTVSLSRINDPQFARVAKQVDFPTLNRDLHHGFAALASETRRLTELIWASNVPLEEAAATVGMTVAEATEVLQDLVNDLEGQVRQGAVAKVRSADQLE